MQFSKERNIVEMFKNPSIVNAATVPWKIKKKPQVNKKVNFMTLVGEWRDDTVSSTCSFSLILNRYIFPISKSKALGYCHRSSKPCVRFANLPLAIEENYSNSFSQSQC